MQARSSPDSVNVLAGPAPPGLAMNGAPLLGTRFPPLGVVYMPTKRSEIDASRPLEISVRGDRTQKIALDPLSLLRPLEQLALLFPGR
jgi:hypothetical protein